MYIGIAHEKEWTKLFWIFSESISRGLTCMFVAATLLICMPDSTAHLEKEGKP